MNKILIAIIVLMAAFGFWHFRQMKKDNLTFEDLNKLSKEELIERIKEQNKEHLQKIAKRLNLPLDELNFKWFADKSKAELRELANMCTCDFKKLVRQNMQTID